MVLIVIFPAEPLQHRSTIKVAIAPPSRTGAPGCDPTVRSRPQVRETRLQAVNGRRVERRPAQLGRIQRGARHRRQARRRDAIAARVLRQQGEEGLEQQRPLVEHAAGVGHGDVRLRRNVELVVDRIDDALELAGRPMKQFHGLRIACRGRSRDQRRQRRDVAAAGTAIAVDGRAHVEVGLETEVLPHQVIPRTTRRMAIGHARKQTQGLARHPVGRALVAEQFAPAARARRSPAVLAITDGAGAGDQVDAVLAGDRAAPAARRIIAAAVTSGRERRRRRRVELGEKPAILAIGRQTEEGEIHTRGRHRAAVQRRADAAPEQAAQRIPAHLKVVRRAFDVRAQHPAHLVDEQKRRLAAAAVDPEIRSHAPPRQGWIETPLTTRLTVPAALGLSGLSLSDSERIRAIDCAKTAYGRQSTRSENSAASRAASSAAPSTTLSSLCVSPGRAHSVITRPATPSRRNSAIRSQSYCRVYSSLLANTTTSVRAFKMVFGPCRKPKGESAATTTLPSVSSSILSAASRASPLSSLLPRYTARSNPEPTRSCSKGRLCGSTRAAARSSMRVRVRPPRTAPKASAPASTMPVK